MGKSLVLAAVLVLSGLTPAAHAQPGDEWAVCDRIPDAYPTPPAGAVVVEPVDEEIQRQTAAHPRGTTFWLAPGTHTLGTDEFGQIMPKAGNTYLGAPGAVIDGRGRNRYAFTGDAPDVVLRDLTIQYFVAPRDEGVVNHDSADGWVVEHNTIQDNKGAGLMAGARQRVVGNCLRDNGQYGMNAYKDGDLADLVVTGNEITDNNDFLVEHNLFEYNDAEALFYETSYNAVIRDNTFRGNTVVLGRAFASRGDDFPVGTVYISESGGEPRVPARTARIEISGNTFEQNWSGVTLWENADRFCNSPFVTSPPGTRGNAAGVAVQVADLGPGRRPPQRPRLVHDTSSQPQVLTHNNDHPPVSVRHLLQRTPLPGLC